MKLRAQLFSFVLLALGAPLAAQQDVWARLAGRVPTELVAQLEEIAADAAARGLPVEPLVQKALEGAAKGAPSDRLLAAVRGVAARLDAGATALRQGGITRTDPEAITAAAFALNAGLGGGEVAVLARATGAGRSAAVTLRVAGTLAALGVPAAETVALVSAALAAGQPPAELLTLPGRVQAEMTRGATPAQAAAGVARAVSAAGRAGPPFRPGPPTRPSRPPNPPGPNRETP